METSKKKDALRAQVRAARGALAGEERTEKQRQFDERLLALPELHNASCIGVYLEAGSELGLTDAVAAMRAWDNAPQIVYPVVLGEGKMVFAELEGDDELAIIIDPKKYVTVPDESKVVEPEELDVLLVPGVAFDAQGHRLGQGGGFYDRYLPLLRDDCPTIAVAFDEQIVDEVPCEEHDLRVQRVITPTRDIVVQ